MIFNIKNTSDKGANKKVTNWHKILKTIVIGIVITVIGGLFLQLIITHWLTPTKINLNTEAKTQPPKAAFPPFKPKLKTRAARTPKKFTARTTVPNVKEPQPQLQINAANGVVSLNQQGGITAGTVNINEFPEPKFEVKTVKVAQKENRGQKEVFVTEYLLRIDSKTALKNLYLEAHAPSIVSFDVEPERSGGWEQGVTGVRKGYAFTNFPGAYGDYRLTIVCSDPDRVQVGYNYQ